MKLCPPRTAHRSGPGFGSRLKLSLAISALLSPTTALAQAVPVQAQGDPTTASQSTTTNDQQTGETEQPTTTLNVIEVQGEYIPEPLLQSSSIMQVVTQEDLARQGDSNAAQALERVAGLSLKAGKFVYIRGLGERYSAALLNGSPLPSPEPLKRVVPLDLFPASVLKKIEVQKTYSASYPAEFGGGLIKLQTVSTPDVPFLTLAIGIGGHSETTFQPGLTYYGSDTDYLGYDDGTRKIPGALAQAIATGQRITAGNFSDQQLKRIGRSLVNAPLNLIQTSDSIDPDFSIEASAGKAFDTQWGKLGLVAVAGFKNQWRTRVGVQQDGAVENGRMVVRTDYDYLSTRNEATVNALVGIGAEFGADHRLNLTTLYVHDTTKQARSREGFSATTGAQVRDDYTHWFERELVDTQLAGSHAFGEYRDLNVEWRVAHARASREAPYEKGIRYRLVDGRYQHDASQEQNYTRFSTVTDRIDSAGIDFHWNLPIERNATLSFGYAWMDNTRFSTSREFRFLAMDGSLPDNVRLERVDFLLSDYNISRGLIGLRETTGADGAAAYDATLQTDAVYAELEASLTPTLRATVGVRYEDAHQAVVPIDLFGDQKLPTALPLQNDYFLPAATATWTIGDNMQIRLGASQTISRPQFRELAPQQYLDPGSDRLFIGNPYLVDSQFLNLDARYEWYFAEREYFTFGLFYKDIERPIESVLTPGGSVLQQTFLNAPRAVLYGAEVEYKKYFDPAIAADWWGETRIYLGANYTWSKSEVQVEAGDVVYTLAGREKPQPAASLVRDGSQLQGQSEHLANLQFGLDNEAARFQATLLFGYTGERITARGRAGEPDLIQEPETIVDLVLRKGFLLGDTEMTLSFEANNILGEEFQEYQALGGGRVDINRYDIGTSYTFKVSAEF